jgi:hypothetical protein
MEKKINSLFSETEDRERLADIFKYLSGIKHGNPAYSGLGFPARGDDAGLLISTGEINDTFSEEFCQQIASCSKYQLAWSAQTLNVCTGKYAIVDKGLEKKENRLLTYAVRGAAKRKPVCGLPFRVALDLSKVPDFSPESRGAHFLNFAQVITVTHA